MKKLILISMFYCSISGFSVDKSHLRKLENDFQEVAKEKIEDAKDSLERVGDEARDLLKKGLNEVADGLNNLERKVRKMANEK